MLEVVGDFRWVWKVEYQYWAHGIWAPKIKAVKKLHKNCGKVHPCNVSMNVKKNGTIHRDAILKGHKNCIAFQFSELDQLWKIVRTRSTIQNFQNSINHIKHLELDQPYKTFKTPSTIENVFSSFSRRKKARKHSKSVSPPNPQFHERKIYEQPPQSTITCSKLTSETLEQGVKYVQS